MIRPDEKVTPARDERYEALWDRLPGRGQRRVEETFLAQLGSDVLCEAEAAESAGTDARYAQLGRWLALTWREYRHERLDALVADGTLR